MKISEILLEYGTSGGTTAGSISSIPMGTGGPMMPLIRRMPAGQSFFGPAGTAYHKPRKKRSKSRK